jgi:hypothetical protein
VGDDEFGVLNVQGHAAIDDDLPRQVIDLTQDVVQARPMYGEQDGVRLSDSFKWGTGSSIPYSLTREFL